MDALAKIGEPVRATQFIGQSSGIYHGSILYIVNLSEEVYLNEINASSIAVRNTPYWAQYDSPKSIIS